MTPHAARVATPIVARRAGHGEATRASPTEVGRRRQVRGRRWFHRRCGGKVRRRAYGADVAVRIHIHPHLDGADRKFGVRI